MQFGDPSTLAIECVHEPVPNSNRWVFGRMCLWLDGVRVGNYEEPQCMLNVTVGHLEATLQRLPLLEIATLSGLSDAEMFRAVDHALYADDGRTTEEVVADAVRYRMCDFLTHGGESFEHTKSFICRTHDTVRIVFDQPTLGLVSTRVQVDEFTRTVSAFIDWVQKEGGEHAG